MGRQDAGALSPDLLSLSLLLDNETANTVLRRMRSCLTEEFFSIFGCLFRHVTVRLITGRRACRARSTTQAVQRLFWISCELLLAPIDLLWPSHDCGEFRLATGFLVLWGVGPGRSTTAEVRVRQQPAGGHSHRGPTSLDAMHNVSALSVTLAGPLLLPISPSQGVVDCVAISNKTSHRE